MPEDFGRSIGDDATLAGAAKCPPSSEASLGDERTLGGGNAGGLDTVIDDIEVVDLESRYQIEGTLGQGGMGAVLLATDTRLDRKVAIKRILGESARSKAAIARFLTEAKSIAALNHPNIVQIYDYGRAKDGPFLIMEYVAGGSLLDKCRDGALPLEEAVAMASQLCDGLAKAHDLGIIHRDIKPANVLLTKDGIPKLTDFGLAKAQSGDHGQTMTGAVLGTPDFMPPEQRRDASLVDQRSDLWSLAATVYQMVTGRSPKIIRFDLLPAELTKVLGKALEDSKEHRFQSAREMRDALRSEKGWATQPPVPAPVIPDELQEGQCKACGTVTSDLTKKFCRNPKCGASLRVACLKCDAQIPVWDGVCGDCGGNQPAMIEARSQELAAKQSKSEELVAALAFDEAVMLAMAMTAESRPEFATFSAWASEFVETTIKERDRVRARADRSFEDARRHADACDYPAAIHAIEAIPAPFRDAATALLLERCRSQRAESEQLIAAIAGRIKRKELAGLLPLIERASALRSDRQDLAKIVGQLSERRAASIKRAREALRSGDLKIAAAAFSGLSRTELYGEGNQLLDLVERAVAIETRIVKAVAAAKADGVVTPEEAADLLVLCEEYLELNPNSMNVQSLADRCRGIAQPLLQLRQREREQYERERERGLERKREHKRERERERLAVQAANLEKLMKAGGHTSTRDLVVSLVKGLHHESVACPACGVKCRAFKLLRHFDRQHGSH
jgi:hypothetical protein